MHSGTCCRPGQNTEGCAGASTSPADARILCWLEEFAAYLMNRCDIGSDCITIETDQRPVQEILKDLDLECANHIADPMRRGEEESWTMREATNARERTEGEQGQPETQRDWDDESDRSDRRRVQVTSDGENDSQALTGGDITNCKALVARVSYLSQDRPGLKFASMQASCGADQRLETCEKGSEDTSLAGQERSAGSCGNRVATSKRARTQTGEATLPPDDQSRSERSWEADTA